MPLHLSGEKVFLRALDERDLARIAATYQDFDLQLTTDGDAPPMSDVQVKAFWSGIISEPGADLRYFAIEPLPDHPHAGQIVGACSLQHIDLRNRHAELSVFMLTEDVRGLGYGTEAVALLLRYAFDALRLDKVYLGVYDFNEAGMRSYEKAGLRYEGRHRQMLHYEGRYWDEWHMGILRAEWERDSQPPADGLRLYHPADLDAAMTLMQTLLQEEGEEGGAFVRSLLRRWWRQADRTFYSFQADGKLVGVLTLLDDDGGRALVADVLVDESYRDALQQALEKRDSAG